VEGDDGSLLDLNPRAMIICGIGIITPPGPTASYISPTDGITETGTRRDLAGLTFEFLYAPDTEAPEEMHVWIPQLQALTCAENANHTLHNIQTLRGARTRDARNFARAAGVHSPARNRLINRAAGGHRGPRRSCPRLLLQRPANVARIRQT
jgi:alkyl sulfatase BDS1-like metallo-beta-lactamase superfamily hydrolase